MHRIAAALLLTLTACGSLHRGGSAGANRLRLCIENATVGYGNIVAHADLVRFDVMPGEVVCKPLPASNPTVALRAATTGGGAAGPVRYATRLQMGGASCWKWRLTDSPASAADVSMCDDGTGSPAASRDSARR